MLIIPKNSKIFILSDTHFQDWSNQDEIASFISFLETVREQGKVLFLLGDIFDFYFEYKSFLPKSFFNIFYELKKTSEKGIDIHYWMGNHDFWVGKFFGEVGIIKHFHPETVKIGTKKILIQHGDEMDMNFMIKTCLTNGISKTLFSLLHPELGLKIAKIVSKRSNAKTKGMKFNRENFKVFAENKFAEGIDDIVMGHFHKPFSYKKGKKTLSVIGDWKNNQSYGLIVNGKISVMRFTQSPR
jgi:UDP-2,3-diacylglucosamine hydrolase